MNLSAELSHTPLEHSRRSMRWTTQDLLSRLSLPHAGPLPVDRVLCVEPCNTWMLTGATGWLGRHMARLILRHDKDAFLLLPVRADSTSQAMERLRNAITPTRAISQEAENDRWWLRIQALPIVSLANEGQGGLPNPMQPVDYVVHCAANMSLALDVDQAWEDNVVATQRVWDWAMKHGAKRFDHVSTLSVFVAADTPMGDIREEDPLERAGALWGGYAASKWAAEAWLAAQDGPMALTVHRPGLLSYSHTDGWARGDGLAAVAQAWKQWGKPAWAWSTGRERMDWSPVDTVASAMLAAMGKGATGPLHWASERSIPGRTIVDVLAGMHGQQAQDWPQQHPVGKTARRALGRWADSKRAEQWWWHDLFQSGRHRFRTERSHRVYQRWDWSPDELKAAFLRD